MDMLHDQPHALVSFLEVVSSLGANVLDVNHKRRNIKAAIGSCVVSLSLETRDKAHIIEDVKITTELLIEILERIAK